MNKPLRILMIGAHPDDNDGCGGGTALKYRKAGHRVRFLSVSDGRCGHQALSPEELIPRRRAEGEAVGAMTGIEYDIWDLPDAEIEASLENRRRLIRYIRAYAPDIIFTHRVNDYHADHRNTGLLVQDSAYLLAVPNLCPDAPALTHMPVVVFYEDRFQNPPFRADVAVALDDVMEEKYRMLACHESQYFEWLPYLDGLLDTVPAGHEERIEWMRSPRIPRDRILTEEELTVASPCVHGEHNWTRPAVLHRDILRKRYGDKADTTLFAEAFEISAYGRQPSEEEMETLFPL